MNEWRNTLKKSAIPPRRASSTRRRLLLAGLLSNNMDVHGRRFPQEAMDDREIKVFAPVSNRRPAKDDLGDVFSADKFGDGIGDAGAFELDDLRPEIFAKSKIG